MKTKLLIILVIVVVGVFFNQITKAQITSKKTQIQNKDKGKEWLQGLFKCKNGKTACFDNIAESEQKICTKRFYEFMSDTWQYEHTTKKFRKKWSKIYPLENGEIGEITLFGRGNGDYELGKQKIEVKKISNLKYNVYIDFGDEFDGGKSTITSSEVTLIQVGNSFKIDFCKTKFIRQPYL